MTIVGHFISDVRIKNVAWINTTWIEIYATLSKNVFYKKKSNQTYHTDDE